MTYHRLSKDCPATAIPAGEPITLRAGIEVLVTQTLGGHVTVRTDEGLFRIARENAGALAGFEPPREEAAAPGGKKPFQEADVWAALKTCFDPEIPVNIVDLGLVYDLKLGEGPAGSRPVMVKMTLTAPGCGMGPVIAEDARRKIAELPGVASARVEIVWDPVWNPQMISPEGRKILGLD